MTDLITREWNGKTIRQREDGYICLTDMAKACGKEFKEWYRTNKAKELIRAVASEVGISTSAVVERVSGGVPNQQGAWGHRYIAIDFAGWLNVQFKLQVIKWTDELMETGKVELTQHPEQNNVDALTVLNQMMQTFNQQQQKLNQHEDKLIEHGFEINETKDELDILKNRIEEYQNQPDANNAKFTIDQYCRINNLEPSRGQSISGGRKLTSLSRILAIDFNDNGSRKNEYPYWLLKALFDTVLDFDVDFTTLVQKYLEFKIREDD